MSSAREHHAKADQLLKQASTEQDSTRRSQILVEAQVHSNLARAAATTTARTTGAGSQARTESPFGEVTPVSANQAPDESLFGGVTPMSARRTEAGRRPGRTGPPDASN
jgi:hypothetical protein